MQSQTPLLLHARLVRHPAYVGHLFPRFSLPSFLRAQLETRAQVGKGPLITPEQLQELKKGS